MRLLDKRKEFVQRILAWASENQRSFPWRKTSDPYRILITEHLLTKTTAKQVNDVYEAFFTAFPSFAELARSPKDEITTIVRPLGLQNRRTDLLHRISVKLFELGGVPRGEDQLLSLPGVGHYCANAVRCLAFGVEVPMVDRSVVRVVNRVFSLLGPDENPSSAKSAKSVRNFLEGFMQKGASRSFNLGLLDFAAAVCKANNPLCSLCPQNALCDWYAHVGCSHKTNKA